MKAQMAGLIGAIIIAAAALLPAPCVNIDSPRLLYTLAIYKSVTGDTDSALRLLQRAESDSQPASRRQCDPPM